MANDTFVAVNVHSFKNEVTKDNVSLVLGFKDDKPHYRINSGVIPITGEFTGYPMNIMRKWFESMGYTYIGKFGLGHNVYKAG